VPAVQDVVGTVPRSHYIHSLEVFWNRVIWRGRAIKYVGGTDSSHDVVALLYHTFVTVINIAHTITSLGTVVIWNSVARRRKLSVKIVPLQSSFSSLADLDHTSPTTIDTSCKPATLSTTGTAKPWCECGSQLSWTARKPVKSCLVSFVSKDIAQLSTLGVQFPLTAMSRLVLLGGIIANASQTS
jgi:hypothetical protein